MFGIDVFNNGHLFSFATEEECSPKDDCEYCQGITGGKQILKRWNYNWCNYPANKGCALITGPIKLNTGKSSWIVAKPKKAATGQLQSRGNDSFEQAETLAKSWSLSECDCSNGYIDMTATHEAWKEDDPSTHGASYPIKSPVGCNDTYTWGDQKNQMGNRGCTDPMANNYKNDAVNDDGSCQYDEGGNETDCATDNRKVNTDRSCGGCLNGFKEDDTYNCIVDCASENRKTNTDNSCGDCDDGYTLDEDTDSDTYGECMGGNNTLLYAGIGGVALILLVMASKK